MHKMKLFLFISLILACSKENITTENSSEELYSKALKGKWKAVSLFLSDASTGVCHQNKPNKDITFEFDNQLNEDKTSFSFSGQAPVNRYFGTIVFNSFDASTSVGKITIKGFGGTKMAGSPEMMDCEQNFYTMLAESTDFQLFADDPKRLIIGRLRDANSHPRDGGTYYVFEKLDK